MKKSTTATDSMALRITITADDAGMSAGIDTAIHEMYKAGTLSTASVMMTMPEYARQYQQLTMPVGIHLDLTEGTPITDTLAHSHLINANGTFRGQLNTIRAGVWLSRSTRDAIQRELNAQIQAFLGHFEQATHITTHHHFHALPALKPIVYALAQHYQIAWVRNPYWRRAVLPQNIFLPSVPAHKPDFTMPDYVVLVQAWIDKPPAVLWQQLEQLAGWVEIVVHPSLEHDPTFPVDVMLTPEARANERAYLEALVHLIDTPHRIDN